MPNWRRCHSADSTAGWSVAWILAGERDFLFSKTIQILLWGTPSLLFNGHQGSFPGIKLPCFKVDHHLPSSAEVKNERSYTSTPPICLHGTDRDNFTFFYLQLRYPIQTCYSKTPKSAITGKAIPLQAWTGTEGSRKLRLPDFVTTVQDGGRLSALRTGRLYPQGNSAIKRILCQWKIQWHQPGSNQRPSDL